MVLLSRHFVVVKLAQSGGGGAGEVEAVYAHSNADTVYFGLGWSNGGDHSGVYDFTTVGDGRFCYKEDGVVASWHAGTYALGQAS